MGKKAGIDAEYFLNGEMYAGSVVIDKLPESKGVVTFGVSVTKMVRLRVWIAVQLLRTVGWLLNMDIEIAVNGKIV